MRNIQAGSEGVLGNRTRHMRLRIGMRQVFWFSVAGGLAFLTDAAIVTALTHDGWLRPEVARLPSFLAAVFVTWIPHLAS